METGSKASAASYAEMKTPLESEMNALGRLERFDSGTGRNEEGKDPWAPSWRYRKDTLRQARQGKIHTG